jgi:hypothetical protein
LRGIDFSTARLEGARFPADLAPDEITLSVERGTRLR